jgi:hypothetical protein
MLQQTHNITEKQILEKTGLHVKEYSDLFCDTKGDLLENFNAHFDALLKKHFKLKEGAFNIAKSGVNLKIGIDSGKADKTTQSEIYKFIHKLSNL